MTLRIPSYWRLGDRRCRTDEVGRVHVRDLIHLLRPSGKASEGSRTVPELQTCIERDTGDLRLTYQSAFTEGDITARVKIAWTSCQFGGRRPWLECPGCKRRVAALYLGRRPRCRVCTGLSYPSQSKRSRRAV